MVDKVQMSQFAVTHKKDTWQIRQEIVQTLHATGGGHYGGAMSVLDILLVLYKKVAKFNDSLSHENKHKDRIILSKGHAAVALYCVLGHLGIINSSTLKGYGKFQKNLEGHPDMLVTPGVDFSSGSLGQGLSVGLGMAMGLKGKGDVWVILGDGECQEGQIWEAAQLAARYQVDNLFAIVDSNNAQEFGYKHDLNLFQEPIFNLEKKWQAFGWHTEVTNGHNQDSIETSLLNFKNIKKQPSVLIANTKKGFGVPLFESDPEKFHCIHLEEDEYKAVLEGLKLSCNN